MGPCLAAMQAQTIHYYHKSSYQPERHDETEEDDLLPIQPKRPSSASSIFDKFSSTIYGRRRIGESVSNQALTDGRKRVKDMVEAWEVRGATRPMTDFYKKVSVLGEGAYGTVEKWQHLDMPVGDVDDSFVAVKQIKWNYVWGGSWFRDAEKEHEIRKELQVLIHLDHPFILLFREWFEHPFGGMFFVTEMCTGGTLQDVLDNLCNDTSHASRSSKLRLCRRYFREVVYAVSYIHGLEPPVVHRDLKPDNIMLKSKDEWSPIKIIDFGLAELKRAQLGLRQADMQKGTMVFMAPELFSSKPANNHFDERTDLWSLGIIFAWIVTALELGWLQHPFLDKEEGEGIDVSKMSLRRAFREPRAWNRNLFAGQPSGLGIAEGVLDYEPGKRTPAADLLQQPWLQCEDPAAAAAARLLTRGALRANLTTFAKLDPVERKILEYAADHSSESDVILLRRTFRILDLDCDGRLSYEELEEGFERNGVSISQGHVKDLFNEFSTDGQSSINYQEWLAATIGPKCLKATNTVALAFKKFDTSGNGFISFEDLTAVVGEEEALNANKGKRKSMNHEEFLSLVNEVAEKRSSIRGSVSDTKVNIEIGSRNGPWTSQSEDTSQYRGGYRSLKTFGANLSSRSNTQGGISRFISPTQ